MSDELLFIFKDIGGIFKYALDKKDNYQVEENGRLKFTYLVKLKEDEFVGQAYLYLQSVDTTEVTMWK